MNRRLLFYIITLNVWLFNIILASKIYLPQNHHQRHINDDEYEYDYETIDYHTVGRRHKSNKQKFKIENYLQHHSTNRHRHHHNYYNVHSGGGKVFRSIPETFNEPIEVTPWPIKKEAIEEGDLILGGLMMVHSREDSITCGPIMPQGGIQALEAMLYTLDVINNQIKLLPKIRLGAHILDDCDKDTYGLEVAVDFIKGKTFYFNKIKICEF